MSGVVPTVLVNGKVVNCVPSTDRGLLYGDGIFETIAVRAGRLCFWERHVQRLLAGCERLGIEPVDVAQLAQECQLLVPHAQQAVIKIILTRGSGGRGYHAPEPLHPTRIIQLHDWPGWPADCAEAGIYTRVCRTRLGHNASLAGIKHLNRLEQVLARREWTDPATREGLMLDTAGNVVEGTMSNVFLVKDARLVTPDLTLCGVAGIMRARVLELAKQHSIATHTQPVALDTLWQADEVFVCNSLIGIWPVIGIDTQAFPRGPVTMRLQALLADEPMSVQMDNPV
ncbi:MAG: aminodeoxychorismate lyase [Gammaproteobacteria bacterium]|jgi:4-amino-4-deoxychorismate lyase|nr:aminodeoxychorismate lyase [Gammaproteobacteria bacterium]